MKNYKVNVNGTEYVVSIELISEEEAKKAQSAAPAPSAAPSAAPATGDGAEITSPMQGTILAVNVANGDTVKKGDVLFILEAMKMENEIMAPNDGTITSVSVQKGASVANGTPLCTLK
ncbi:MAG: biotin/lipoyl-binding protein [Clostridia bacterium]|nr:biotin/lipoyl-binding protein [Clostridia bacterium]